jgi:long-chain acyl-CoA synthetase
LPMLGTRNESGEYSYQTYGEVALRVRNLAAALHALGVTEKARVGLYSINRAEWIIGEYAIYSRNAITVPLYDTLGAAAVEQIAAQAEVSAVLCSEDKVARVVEIARLTKSIKVIIVMEKHVWEKKEDGGVRDAAHVRVLTFAQAEALGAETVSKAPVPDSIPTPEDLATICYTSGTTGQFLRLHLSSIHLAT